LRAKELKTPKVVTNSEDKDLGLQSRFVKIPQGWAALFSQVDDVVSPAQGPLKNAEFFFSWRLEVYVRAG